MMPRAREIETLLLAMFAAVPLYLTHAIGVVPLIVFHAFMTAVIVRVAAGKGPELVPLRLMRWLAIGYVPFYVVDWLGITHSAVAASTHLVLFIAAYQPMESIERNNHAQRLLTAGLIFTASVATSTHLTIILFIIAFGFLMFRQMMYVSHLETVRSLELPYAQPPVARAALFYLLGATLIAAVLFPMLPRLRNPFVQGLSGQISGASTGLSEAIDFSEERTANPGDGTVVARVWMDLETRPFFTPVRLRGNIYDIYEDGKWEQTFRGLRAVGHRNGTYTLARPSGVTRKAIVQMRAQRGKLFLPVGTYAISGAANLYEGPARETYHTYDRGMLNLDVSMAYSSEPLRLVREKMSGYPVSPQLSALAHRIVGNEQSAQRKAALIETHLLRNYRYLPNTATPAEPVSLDQFLLVRREGHCEYFAAGMVALLNAVDVPARIAGGFYGGRHNPLTGYYAIRREDAHAWTEVWDGTRWLTFDATPPSLRPGSEAASTLRMYVSALMDSVTYFWDRYVLTFGLSDQITLIADLITWGREQLVALRSGLRADVRQLAGPQFAVTLALVLAAGVAVIALARRQRRPFDLLAAFLKERGIEVGEAMTMEEALRKLDADSARAVAPLVALYEEEEFSARRDPARRRLLRRRLANLRQEM
jgi:transglutaminase-like putative cysteine protease